jgi:hypothetical protein
VLPRGNRKKLTPREVHPDVTGASSWHLVFRRDAAVRSAPPFEYHELPAQEGGQIFLRFSSFLLRQEKLGWVVADPSDMLAAIEKHLNQCRASPK